MGIAAMLGGPTASGKTELALRWAQRRGWEILSADSRQIYRGFTIGTGTPSAEEMRAVPHHLVAAVDPRDAFSPKRFREEVLKILRDGPEQNFLLVGGTGLYIKELLFPGREDRGETPPEIRAAAQREIEAQGLQNVHAALFAADPEGMRGVHPHDGYRIRKRLENRLITGRSYREFRSAEERDSRFFGIPLLWLNPPRDELHRRIEARIRRMMAQGWVEEVRVLLENYDPESTPAFNALGYREMIEVAQGRLEPETARASIAGKTRRYARRQTTFFRHQFQGALAMEPAALRTALEIAEWDAGRLPILAPHRDAIDKRGFGA